MAFTDLALHPSLLRGIKELGFLRPTPIQAQAIPPIMAKHDVLACAETGSGKTAAFLLPIVHRLIDRPRGATRALVLAPTRELAGQIRDDLQDLAVHTPITGFAVFGGVDMRPQEHALRSGVDIIVATPGRLLDHLRAPYANFSKLEFLVLDEADRMLDMGFLPDIRRILRTLPAKRQTLMFSATMPQEIQSLTNEMLHSPVTIGRAREAMPASSITQAVYPVPQELKSSLLAVLLERGDVKQALVFTRTKHRANRVTDFLLNRGLKADRIHGNRSQSQRTTALSAFKNGRTPVLVATDIAARGIDVTELGHVINFDVPLAPEDYVHRVGRTGRAEATGDAFTFVAPEEEGGLRAIEKAIGRRLPRVTVPDFDYAARPAARLEIPLAQRLAAMREQRRGQRPRGSQHGNRPQGRTSESGHGHGHSRGPGQGHSHGHGHSQSSGQGHGQGHGQSHGQGHGQGQGHGHGQGSGHGRGHSQGGQPPHSSAAPPAPGAGRRRRFRPRRRR